MMRFSFLALSKHSAPFRNKLVIEALPALVKPPRSRSTSLIRPDSDSTTLGVADLKTVKTGGTSTTSAASVILFGKDGKVLWQAP